MLNVTKKIPILFNKKEECCACGACLNICPMQAISMCEDENGFIFPKIDESKCIACKKCKNVCSFQKIEETHKPIETYAAVSSDLKLLSKSASGGVFATLAEQILTNGGNVCGAAFNDTWNVEHIIIDNKSELNMLQGSKYTQSNIGRTYTDIRVALNEGKKILFSGTPCQVAGLYGFLGRNYENLITVDIVCHGVPNNKMFSEYIDQIQSKEKGKVKKFTFRDKTTGWGINGKAFVDYNGRILEKKIWQSASSYLYLFSKGWIYRESCYKCKYACSHRPGDLTIGDFWGVERVNPEFLGSNGWDESKGISLLVINTKKGDKAIESVKDKLELKRSEFSKASLYNTQLRKPSCPGKRDEILAIYKDGGWRALENNYKKTIGIRKYSSQIKSLIPLKIKRIMKKFRR